MKNVHILPTDKPSRLYKTGNFLLLDSKAMPNNTLETKNQNIYITNDSEIKVGDWYYLPRTNYIYKCIEDPTGLNLERRLGVAKIILTTDQDLIKDGIQPIDDDFLEWFVRNPSCEFVEVYHQLHKDEPLYKIILPQEEPNKTHYLDELPNMDKKVLAKMWESAMPKLEPKQEISDEAKERAKNYMRLKGALEPKQETLEEVRKVERSDLYNKIHSIVKQIPREDVETDAMDASSCAYDIEQLFYKWQQERMYSEEEVRKIAEEVRWQAIGNPLEFTKNFEKWFEQQKKK
jgi:hypothetical protein